MKYFILLMISFYTLSLFGLDNNSDFSEAKIMEIAGNDSISFAEEGYEVIKTVTKLPNGFQGVQVVSCMSDQDCEGNITNTLCIDGECVSEDEEVSPDNKIYIAVLLKNGNSRKIKLIIKNLDNDTIEVKDIYTESYDSAYPTKSSLDFVVDKANEVMFVYSYETSVSTEKTVYLHYSQVGGYPCNTLPFNNTNGCKIDLLDNYSPVSITLTKENDNPYISLLDSQSNVRVLKLPKAWSITSWTVALTESGDEETCPKYDDTDRGEDIDSERTNFACIYFVKSLSSIKDDTDFNTAINVSKLEILEDLSADFNLKLAVSLTDNQSIFVPAYSLSDVSGTYLYTEFTPNSGGGGDVTHTDIDSLLDNNNNMIKTYFLKKSNNYEALYSIYNGENSGNELSSFSSNSNAKTIKLKDRIISIVSDNTDLGVQLYLMQDTGAIPETQEALFFSSSDNTCNNNITSINLLSVDSANDELYFTYYLECGASPKRIITTKISLKENVPNYKIVNNPSNCEDTTDYKPLSLDSQKPMIINFDKTNNTKFLCLKGTQEGGLIRDILDGGGLLSEEVAFEILNCNDNTTYCYKKIKVKDSFINATEKSFALFNIQNLDNEEDFANFYLSYAQTGINDLITWPHKPMFMSTLSSEIHPVVSIIPNLNGRTNIMINGSISLPSDSKMEITEGENKCTDEGSTLSEPCKVYLKFKDFTTDGSYFTNLNIYNNLVVNDVKGVLSSTGIVINSENNYYPLLATTTIHLSNNSYRQIKFENISGEMPFYIKFEGITGVTTCPKNSGTLGNSCEVNNIQFQNNELNVIKVCLNGSGCNDEDQDQDNDFYNIFLSEDTNSCGSCKEWEHCDESGQDPECVIDEDRCSPDGNDCCEEGDENCMEICNPDTHRCEKDVNPLLFWSQEGFKECENPENGKICINDIALIVNNEYETTISIAKEVLLEDTIEYFVIPENITTEGVEFVDLGAEDCRNVGQLSVPGDICYIKIKFSPTKIEKKTEVITIPNIADFIFTLNVTDLEEDVSVTIPSQEIENNEVNDVVNVNFDKVVEYTISTPFVLEIEHLNEKTGGLKIELSNNNNFFISSNCDYDYEKNILSNNLDKKCNLLVKFIPSEIKKYDGILLLKENDKTIKTINLTGEGIEDTWKENKGWCAYSSNNDYNNSIFFILFLFFIVIIRRKILKN